MITHTFGPVPTTSLHSRTIDINVDTIMCENLLVKNFKRAVCSVTIETCSTVMSINEDKIPVQ